MSFISDENSAIFQYINKLNVDYKKVRFEEEYPYSSTDISGILYSMLEFNPYFRKPASQILKGDVFKSCRKDYPDIGNDAPKKISLEYDKKNAFDYDEADMTNTTIDDLKQILLREIKILRSLEYK